MSKYFLILLLLLPTLAYSAPLADCAYSTVNTAVGSASPGDTIELPACVDTDWSSSTLSIDKELTLTGQGYGSTSIINANISVNNTVGETITISNFKITGAAPSGKGIVHITGGVTDFRVTGMYITWTANYGLSVSGYTHGLIDNSVFYATSGASAIYIQSDSEVNQYGRASQLGTANQVIIEDCSITRSVYAGTTHAIWSQTGGSYTARCNYVDNLDFDVHGSCSGQGSREFEFYGNKFEITNKSGGDTAWLWIRGGTGVVFENSIQPTTGSCSGNIGTYEQQITLGNGLCSCPCSSYPCDYQVGRGASQALDPVYVWNNEYEGGSYNNVSIWPSTNDGCSFSGTYPDDYIQENREFYEGTARGGYVPYTYPHPDRGLSVTTTCLADSNSEADTAIQFWAAGGASFNAGAGSSSFNAGAGSTTFE